MISAIRYCVFLLATPLAALAIVLPVNNYRAQGIEAPDCDAPLQVLLFALPALVVYGISAYFFFRGSRGFHRIAGLLCLVIMLAIGTNATAAVLELRHNADTGDCVPS
jgi:hypothetical protein